MKKLLLPIYTGATVVSLLLFLSGPLLAYFRVVTPITGFGLFGLGCLLGVFVTIGGIVAMLRGKTGWVVAVWFMGAVPAGFLAYGLVEGRSYPLINDVSTNVSNPPKFDQIAKLPELQGWDLGFPGENAEIIGEHYAFIKTLPLPGKLDEVFGRARQLASGEPGWNIVGTGSGDKVRLIEGFSETALFHFRDYFVIEIREIDDGAVVVDMRSKSKDGRGDFGVNAQRIHDFFEKLKA